MYVCMCVSVCVCVLCVCVLCVCVSPPLTGRPLTGNTSLAVSGMRLQSLGDGVRLVAALALGTALPFLQLLGFDPGATNGPEEINALRLVYVLPPWLFYAISVAILWRYPISAARLDRLKSAFNRREVRRQFLRR